MPKRLRPHGAKRALGQGGTKNVFQLRKVRTCKALKILFGKLGNETVEDRAEIILTMACVSRDNEWTKVERSPGNNL